MLGPQNRRPVITWMLYFLTKSAVSAYCRIFAPVSVKGLENVPRDRGVILVANHRSTLDGFVIHSLMTRPIFAFIKSDFFENVLVRWYLMQLGGVPVKKGNLRSSTVRETARILKGGHTLMIFPEGRINSGPGLLMFHDTFVKFALKYRVPIIPVAIVGTEKSSIRDWLLRRDIHVVIAPPREFEPSSENNDSVENIVQAIRKLILECMASVTPNVSSPGRGTTVV
jgi:1-acyl-sn-glycerol-3-phosphate acyltransferase